MSKQTILLDTRGRDSGSPLERPVFTLSTTVQGYRLIRLKSFTYVRSDLVIETGVNDTIFYSEVGTPAVVRSAVIPQGNYTGLALTTAIGNAMSAVSGAAVIYTATLNQPTNQLTITAGAGQFKLLFSKAGTPAAVLGFLASDTAFAVSQTGTLSVNLAPSSPILIDIQGLGTDIVTPGSMQFQSNLVVPTDVPSGYQVSYQPAFEDQCIAKLSGTKCFRTMEVFLRTVDGRVIKPLTDWTLVLEVE